MPHSATEKQKQNPTNKNNIQTIVLQEENEIRLGRELTLDCQETEVSFLYWSDEQLVVEYTLTTYSPSFFKGV